MAYVIGCTPYGCGILPLDVYLSKFCSVNPWLIALVVVVSIGVGFLAGWLIKRALA
jgi:hypothetical protein